MKTQFHRTVTLRGDVFKEYEESFIALGFYTEPANNREAVERSQKALNSVFTRLFC
jgi:hypothetical protein